MAKGPDAFRTISEASDELGVPQHVLRFWETRFAFIRPMKRSGGRRFYRPQDIEVLRGVQRLLHEKGYTIKGVQLLHKEQGLRRLVAASGGDVALAAELETELAAQDAVLEGEAALAKAADVSDTISAFASPISARLDPNARARLVAVLEEMEVLKLKLDALLSRARVARPLHEEL